MILPVSIIIIPTSPGLFMGTYEIDQFKMISRGKKTEPEKSGQEGSKKKKTPHLTSSVVADGLSISGVKYVAGHLHGIIRRVIWALVLLGAVSTLLMFTFFRFRVFLNNPKATDIQLRYEGKLEFPSVVLCNLNTMRSTKLFTVRPSPIPPFLGEFDPYSSSVELMRIMSIHTEPGEAQELRQQYIEKYWNHISDTYDGEDAASVVEKAVHTYRHRIEDMLISCRWKDSYCGPENFTAIETDLGVCYQFNADKHNILMTDTPGVRGGLSLTLNAETEEYLENFATISGFKVIIGNMGDPTVFTTNQGFMVSPGMGTFVAVKKEQVDDKANPCGEENFSACVTACYARYSMDRCGCVTFYMGDSLPHCKPNLVATCSIFAEASLIGSANYSSYCGQCIPQCNHTEYQISLSSTRLSDSFINVYLMKNLHKYTQQYPQAMKIKWLYSLFNIEESYRLHFNTLDIQMFTLFQTFNTLRETFNLVQSFTLVGQQLVSKLEELKIKTLDALENFQLWTGNHYFMSGYDPSRAMHEDFRIRVLLTINNFSIFEEFLTGISTSIDGFWNVTYANALMTDLESMDDSGTRVRKVWEKMEGLRREMLVLVDQANATHSLIYRSLMADERVVYLISDDARRSPLMMAENDLAMVTIYYEKLGFTQIKQHLADSALGLFCDIGGTTGLCIGGSVLTLFEIVDVLCAVCFRRYRGKA